MTRQERIRYLCNLLLMIRRDGVIDPEELALVGEIPEEIGAAPEEQDEAERLVEAGDEEISLPERLSDQIRCLEDLIRLTMVDERITAEEKRMVLETARRIGVSQSQLDRIGRQVRQHVEERRTKVTIRCITCGALPVAGARFCAECGKPLAPGDATQVTVTQPEIALSGITVLFPEDELKSNPQLQELLRSESGFGMVVLEGRAWLKLNWEQQDLARAVPVVQALQLIADRRAFFNGARRPWNEIFGFMSCFERRNATPSPKSYCFFGKDRMLNIFGCIKSRMPWCIDADWGKMGKFIDSRTFVFNREAILRELVDRLAPFRFCPALDRRYLAAVQQLLPAQAVIEPGGHWEYREAEPGTMEALEVTVNQPAPDGSIVPIKKLVHGVQPVGVELGLEIVRLALTNSGRGAEKI